MIVIGLTGSIGMGKSTVAAQFAALGIAVSNADAIAHKLMAKGGEAVAGIEKLFPGVVKSGAVDRKALGDIVFKDKAKLALLERLLHPIVEAEEIHFAEIQKCKGAPMAVLEIPLLFETKAEERCDLTVVVTAPLFIQRQRVMKRPGMTDEKWHRIVNLQMPDREKRHRADVIIETGLGKAYSFRQVTALVKTIREKA